MTSEEWLSLSRRLPRITVPITEWFDWDKLRVNVYALVSPGLVKWK